MVRPSRLLLATAAAALLLLADPVASEGSQKNLLGPDPKKDTKDAKKPKDKPANADKTTTAAAAASDCKVNGVAIDGYEFFPNVNEKPTAGKTPDFEEFFVHCGLEGPECFALDNDDAKAKAKKIECSHKDVEDSMKKRVKLKKPVQPPSMSKDDPPI